LAGEVPLKAERGALDTPRPSVRRRALGSPAFNVLAGRHCFFPPPREARIATAALSDGRLESNAASRPVTLPPIRSVLLKCLSRQSRVLVTWDMGCNWHCQTTNTRHPIARNSCSLRASRSLFASAFSSQKVTFEEGRRPSRQSWACQKHP